MDGPVDPTPDSKDEPPRNPPLPKAVKAGAYFGLTLGWLAGLVYVLTAFPSIRFEQQSTADGILTAAPISGVVVGAGVGFFLRNSERFARINVPNWITFKEVTWGWRTGGIVGLFLAQSYIASNSPLGFYTGSIALVFELIAPACAAVGGGIGLLLRIMRDDAGPPKHS